MVTRGRGPGGGTPAGGAAGPPANSRRIEEVFAERDASGVTLGRYSFFNAGHLLAMQERERHLLALLGRHRFDAGSLARCRVLSVGCGGGGELLDLVRWGAAPRALFGVDLEPGRARAAQCRNQAFGIARAAGESLPFRSESFDLVLQFTLLTSVLDPEARRVIASEMLRVLRPGGFVVWYDFWPDNPSNPRVRGIRAGEIRALFPGCACELQRLTLAPPLARRLAPVSWLLADLLARVPLLRTFCLAAIHKPSGRY